MFCYNEKFTNNNILNILKFSKGLKYFLNGCEKSQMKFIHLLKNVKAVNRKDILE